MKAINALDERKWMGVIAGLSIFVVAAVAFLIYNSQSVTTVNPSIYTLPKLNAFLNSSVFILLLAGLYFILKKNIKAHRAAMLTAFIFSCLFLVSYIIYHYSARETSYGDVNHDGIRDAAEKAAIGTWLYIYGFILTTHIILSTIIVPLALITLFRIFNMQIQHHKKIARWTLPIWLYVSSTGVIVYLMISQYYPV